jgi:hypothetical protein
LTIKRVSKEKVSPLNPKTQFGPGAPADCKLAVMGHNVAMGPKVFGKEEGSKTTKISSAAHSQPFLLTKNDNRQGFFDPKVIQGILHLG